MSRCSSTATRVIQGRTWCYGLGSGFDASKEDGWYCTGGYYMLRLVHLYRNTCHTREHGVTAGARVSMLHMKMAGKQEGAVCCAWLVVLVVRLDGDGDARRLPASCGTGLAAFLASWFFIGWRWW